MDAYYRQAYLGEVSKMPGWRRTSRFEALFGKNSKEDGGGGGAPSQPTKPQWLALHEFDGESFNNIDLAFLHGKLEATRGLATIVDISLFKLIRGFGDYSASWVDS